jgi:Surface antigen variable number repeat
MTSTGNTGTGSSLSGFVVYQPLSAVSHRSNSYSHAENPTCQFARPVPPSELRVMSYIFWTRNTRLILHVCVTACLFLMLVQAPKCQQSSDRHAAQSSIQQLEIVGNRRVQRATIMAHIVSRPGDTYDSEAVQRDAQALRDTGYFDEVRLRVEDDPSTAKGKIVAFVVKERPVVRRIEYLGIKLISEADIENACCCAESTAKPGTSASRSTASWCGWEQSG